MRFAEVGDDAVALAHDGVEVWKPLNDCPDRYFVSNLGRVASRVRAGHTTRILTTSLSSAGYLTVGVTPKPGDKSDTRLVHRLVVETFVGPAPTPQHIDIRHEDGDKTNNRLTNVKWGTRSENMRDVYLHRAPALKERTVQRRTEKWYTEDERLRAVGLALYSEGKLTIADLGRLWDCASDVAASIVHGDTRREVPAELTAPRKKRRSPERKAEIAALAKEGLGFLQINERLGETLTAQDVYYYRTAARSNS